MNNRIALIVLSFMFFPRASYGGDSSFTGNFNEYVNSPEGSSGSPVDKNINPGHATHHDEARKNPDNTDTNPVLQGIPAYWRTCAVDSDCTAGVVDCEFWKPLNRKYLHEISKNLNSCSASIDPGFQPETACVDKACKITQKTTGVSWEEWLGEMRTRGQPSEMKQ